MFLAGISQSKFIEVLVAKFEWKLVEKFSCYACCNVEIEIWLGITIFLGEKEL